MTSRLQAAFSFTKSILELCDGTESVIDQAIREDANAESIKIYIPSKVSPIIASTLMISGESPDFCKIINERKGVKERVYGNFDNALEGRNFDGTPHTYFFIYRPTKGHITDYIDRDRISVMPSCAKEDFNLGLEKELVRN